MPTHKIIFTGQTMEKSEIHRDIFFLGWIRKCKYISRLLCESCVFGTYIDFEYTHRGMHKC